MADKNPGDDKDSLKNDALEVNQQFLKDKKAGELGITTERPKFPQYAVVTKRQESFKNWPAYMPIKSDIMVDAGLVYTGVGDSVRCYYCGGGLRNWEAGDNPWEEHAKWYPKCPHVILVKGLKYIDDVGKGLKPEPDCHPQKVKPKGIPSDSELMRSVAAESCLQCGYAEEQVLKAIKIFLKNNAGTTTFSGTDIANILLELEDEQEDEATGGDNVYDCCVRQECDEDPEEIEKLYQENQRLKENQMCKICLDDIANVIFLPCGHMVSCPRCAPALNKCPLCRITVTGTVKAYFE